MNPELDALVAGLEGVLVLGSELVAGSDPAPAVGHSPSGVEQTWRWCPATVADAQRALGLAVAAQRDWAATDVGIRTGLVRRYVELLTARAETMAALIVLETGKTIQDARAEVRVAVGVAEELVRAAESNVLRPVALGDGSVELRLRPAPVGPALLITPWNFPLAMPSRKVVSALLCGCPALVKPSDRTPLTALALGALFVESGVPAGLLSVLPTRRSPELVAALTDDPALRKISFTGSTAVGRQVLQASTRNFQRTSLELGGNAPCVVLPDASVVDTVQTIWASKLFNNGQACTSPNRVLVPHSLAAEIEDAFAELARQSVVDDPWSADTRLGPLVAAEPVTRLTQLVVQRRAGTAVHGARSGAAAPELAATVIIGADADDPLCRSELFGPVLPIVRYPDDDLELCLRLANDTEYGLASYVFGSDPDRIDEVVRRLEFGMTAVNRGSVSHPMAPFGGVKHSGFGRENGPLGLSEYLELHTVHLPPTTSGGVAHA